MSGYGKKVFGKHLRVSPLWATSMSDNAKDLKTIKDIIPYTECENVDQIREIPEYHLSLEQHTVNGVQTAGIKIIDIV